MAVYWVTFRFSPAPPDRGSSEQRHGAFHAVLSDPTVKIWAEPAAFIVFGAAPSIEVVASLFQEAIDPSCDMFLLHEIDGEDANRKALAFLRLASIRSERFTISTST